MEIYEFSKRHLRDVEFPSEHHPEHLFGIVHFENTDVDASRLDYTPNDGIRAIIVPTSKCNFVIPHLCSLEDLCSQSRCVDFGQNLFPKIKLYRTRGLIPVFDQRGELPLLPFGNPIGFVPASRGKVYIESKLVGPVTP